MELDLHTRLRPEQKFPSLEALVEQIGRDVAAVRVWSGN
jgi:FAD synthase